ncbi:c-type cytochrome [Azospirillum sp. HJ39]|uniref:c-type cytochrome n=1 Tax=Azospirillum sp. HJ39 TaxID=3159496 RepID=UPI0035561A00
MRRAPALLLAALLAAGLPLALGAAAAGPRTPDGSASAVDGRSLALALCGDCHVAAPGQPAGPDLAGPDLVERMQDPAMTELALRSHLRTSHPLMPNIRLTRGETDDIVAYLLTLKEDRP